MTDEQFETAERKLNGYLIDEEYIKNHIIMQEHGDWINYPGPDSRPHYSINMSSIETFLIQKTGRFVESYASDMLITLNAFRRDLERETEEKNIPLSKTYTYWFGLRESGVDGIGYIVNRAAERPDCAYFSYYYRKTYAMILSSHPKNKDTVLVTLLNANDAVSSLIREINHMRNNREEFFL